MQKCTIKYLYKSDPLQIFLNLFVAYFTFCILLTPSKVNFENDDDSQTLQGRQKRLNSRWKTAFETAKIKLTKEGTVSYTHLTLPTIYSV